MLQAIKYSRFFNYEPVVLKVRINLELKEHHDLLTDIYYIFSWSYFRFFFFFFNVVNFIWPLLKYVFGATGVWKNESHAIVWSGKQKYKILGRKVAANEVWRKKCRFEALRLPKKVIMNVLKKIIMDVRAPKSPHLEVIVSLRLICF